MPAKSKAQQKFMSLVYALKKGDVKPSDVSQDVKDAAKSMKTKDVKLAFGFLLLIVFLLARL